MKKKLQNVTTVQCNNESVIAIGVITTIKKL